MINDYLRIENNKLYYEDICLPDLCERFGAPLEVAYTEMINKRVKELKKIFSDTICENEYSGKYYYAYATKANYYSEVVTTATNYCDFLETSSGYDLNIIDKLLEKKIIPQNYTVLCNGFKTSVYLDKIIELRRKNVNVIPVLDNINELNMFSNIDKGIKINIGIRLNIDEQMLSQNAEENAIDKIDSRFGMNKEELLYAINKIEENSNLNFEVLHFHLGGTITDIDEYIKLFAKIYEEYYCLIKPKCKSLKYFDFGGGLPAQYNLDFKFDYKDLANKMIQTIKHLSEKYEIECPDLIGEHGRYTTADHGFYIYEVEFVKKAKDDTYWYIINSSLMDFAPDSWGINQNFMILPLNLYENEKVKVKLGGLTCDPDDTYFKQEKENYIYLPEIKEGQKLYLGIFGIGAYQEMITGVGGVHHCFIPEGKELIISKNSQGILYNDISDIQGIDDTLDILGYNNSHNILQYSNKFNLIVKDFTDKLYEEHQKLYNEFPSEEIFPLENIEFACNNDNYKILKFYNGEKLLGTIFLTLLNKNKYLVINYIYIEKEMRNNGYGHIIVNILKSKFPEYKGIIVEVEPALNDELGSINNRRLRYYKDLKFNIVDYCYKILQTGKDSYQDMLLHMYNLKNGVNYKYTYEELIEILDEYYNVIFDEDYKKQYMLEKR